MIKPQVYTLASRVFRMNQEMSAQLIRIQSGFLASKNVDQALETARTMQEMLCELQQALHANKTDTHTAHRYISLK